MSIKHIPREEKEEGLTWHDKSKTHKLVEGIIG